MNVEDVRVPPGAALPPPGDLEAFVDITKLMLRPMHIRRAGGKARDVCIIDGPRSCFVVWGAFNQVWLWRKYKNGQQGSGELKRVADLAKVLAWVTPNVREVLVP